MFCMGCWVIHKAGQITARVAKLELASAKNSSTKSETEVKPKATDTDNHADLSARSPVSRLVQKTRKGWSGIHLVTQPILQDSRSCGLELTSSVEIQEKLTLKFGLKISWRQLVIVVGQM